MGLDQYLYVRNKDSEKEVWYGRKVNFVRKYFTDHADYPEDGNCTYHPIKRSVIDDFIKEADCMLYENGSLIPTEGGFFFGNTEYNESYKNDVKNVCNKFKKMLEEYNENVFYYYEWW